MKATVPIKVRNVHLSSRTQGISHKGRKFRKSNFSVFECHLPYACNAVIMVWSGSAKLSSIYADPGKENSASNDSQIWKEAAFPQYLQESVESSNFCDLWEDAKKRHTTLKGQEMHVKDTTLWRSIRREAEKDARDEPLLSSFLYASILSHDSFARSLSFILANRLSNATMLPTELFELFHTILSKHHKIREHAQADLCAMRERVSGSVPCTKKY